MEAWKARAAAAQHSVTSSLSSSSSTKTPVAKYSPSRYDPNAPPSASASDLVAQSAVLRAQTEQQHRRPPPPPKRSSALAAAGGGGEAAAPTMERSTLASRLTSNTPPARGAPAPPPLSASAAGNDAVATASYKPISQYDERDKLSFFDLMDEFFTTRLELKESMLQKQSAVPALALAVAPTLPFRATPAAPSVAAATRTVPPPSPSRSPAPPPAAAAVPSPLESNPSAITLLHYILYSDHSSSKWYASPTNCYPLILDPAQCITTCRTSTLGSEKRLESYILCSDGSSVWSQLRWSTADDERRLSSRVGRYRLPRVWSGEELYAASERYGPLVVAFAQRALAEGRPIGRGECWDLASLALKAIKETRPDLPEPFPSISKHHGHLIYYASVGASGGDMSLWKGGDQYVRPGDIVQWKSAVVADLHTKGQTYTIGAPDHTAIIISASPPTSLPSDGSPFQPQNLVSLTVIEQSVGSPPVETSVDMTQMSKGEIWISRPVALVEYVGQSIEVVWPPPVESLTL